MAHDVTVLIVIDPSQSTHPTLDHALLLAGRNPEGTSIKMVFLLTPGQQSPEDPVLCSGDWIKTNVYDRLTASHVEQSILLGWGASNNDVILQVAEQLKPTLTIIPYYEKTKGMSFTEERWKLLRNASNPILITSRPPEHRTRRILCALKTQNEAYNERNRRIVEVAKRFSDTFGLETHAVNAYSDSIEYPDRHRIASMSGIKNEHIHVKLGEPQDVICEAADEIDADLTIIASQQRKGWQGALRGNMIEKILARLDRDVLMI